MPPEYLDFIAKIAWPLVGLLALAYVWMTDALAKLINIHKATMELKEQIPLLAEAEKKIAQTAYSLGTISPKLTTLQDQCCQLGIDIDRMTKLLEQKRRQQPSAEHAASPANYAQVDEAWDDLSNTLAQKFGNFDKRTLGGFVVRRSEENETTLDREIADQIAEMHSTIKSFRRRRKTASQWLTDEMAQTFIVDCHDIAGRI